MAVELARRVDYPMLDGANIAYFPRIFDLAHRFFRRGVGANVRRFLPYDDQ